MARRVSACGFRVITFRRVNTRDRFEPCSYNARSQGTHSHDGRNAPVRYQYAPTLRAAQFYCLVTSLWALMTASAHAQEPHKKLPATPGPMLSQGTQQFETPDFKLTLVKSSQTLAALKPKGAGDFDFTPGDLLVERSPKWIFSSRRHYFPPACWKLRSMEELFVRSNTNAGGCASRVSRRTRCRRSVACIPGRLSLTGHPLLGD